MQPVLGGRRTRDGVTLVEMLIVVALMGIVMAMVVPMFDPGVTDQLQAAAMVVAADLDYARGLAISNNSRYSVTFEQSGNRYFVYHSGTNPALETLPKSPFLIDDTSAIYGPRQIADFDELLTMGPRVTIYDMRLLTAGTAVGSLEFGSLGSTTTSDTTVIALACGEGSARRYISISVSPVTGLTTIGNVFP